MNYNLMLHRSTWDRIKIASRNKCRCGKGFSCQNVSSTETVYLIVAIWLDDGLPISIGIKTVATIANTTKHAFHWQKESFEKVWLRRYTAGTLNQPIKSIISNIFEQRWMNEDKSPSSNWEREKKKTTKTIGSECIHFTYCAEDLLLASKQSNCSRGNI